MLTMVLDIDAAVVIDDFNPASLPQRLGERSELALLMHLDSFSGRGLTETQFRSLFLRCRTCQMYVTRRTVASHTCRTSSGGHTTLISERDAGSNFTQDGLDRVAITGEGRVVIDLTGERVVIDLTADD